MTAPHITAPNTEQLALELPAPLPLPAGWELVSGDLGTSGQPDPQWVRGLCPLCGAPVVSNLYYVGGKGYLNRWECWNGTGMNDSCDYKRVI